MSAADRSLWRRYASLLAVQVKSSLLLAAAYRWEFLVEGLVEVLWTVTSVLPLLVVYRVRADVAGWRFGEAMLVVAWFTLLQGVLDGAINPSLTSVVEHVRKGTLDFVLLKPADAQFLLSTARFQPWRAMNVVTALVVFGLAFRAIGHGPTALGVLASLVLLAGAVVLLYSLWILTVSAAFYVVRIDNLTHLFSSVFDAARWPSSVFRGVWHFVFTFVLPLALMTTYPAKALLGRLTPSELVGALVLAVVFFVGSRAVWLRAIAQYTSASS